MKYNLKIVSRKQAAIIMLIYSFVLCLMLMVIFQFIVLFFLSLIIGSFIILYFAVISSEGEISIEITDSGINIKVTKNYRFFKIKYQDISWNEISSYEIIKGGQMPFVIDMKLIKSNGEKILFTFLNIKKNRITVNEFLNSFISNCKEKQINIRT